jgi:alpha/beta superfamily hydrolase
MADWFTSDAPYWLQWFIGFGVGSLVGWIILMILERR